MPRIKYKKAIITIVFGSIVLLIHQYHKFQHSEDSRLIIATNNVLKAIGNRSTSTFVLPDERTVILQPGTMNCQNLGSGLFALFMVISSPENRKRRDVIRTTLASYLEHKTVFMGSNSVLKLKLLFFVGVSPKYNLADEFELHGDIVVDNFQESYLNLTLKTLRMLKYFNKNCRDAEYVIKMDDDVHVNVPKFLKFLQQVKNEKTNGRLLVAGYKYDKIGIDSNPYSKWFTPEYLWPQKTLPYFAAGFFYVLGTEAASKIYNASLQTPLFHLEDVFITGMVATVTLNMEILHIPQILVYWSPLYSLYTTSCTFQNSYMVVHSASPQQQQCWSLFNSQGFICGITPILFYC